MFVLRTPRDFESNTILKHLYYSSLVVYLDFLLNLHFDKL